MILFTNLSPIQILAMERMKLLNKHGKPNFRTVMTSVMQDDMIVPANIINRAMLDRINKYVRDNFDILAKNII